jgi:hypothetical protein
VVTIAGATSVADACTVFSLAQARLLGTSAKTTAIRASAKIITACLCDQL